MCLPQPSLLPVIKALEVTQLCSGTQNHELGLLPALVLKEQRVFFKFYGTPFENA